MKIPFGCLLRCVLQLEYRGGKWVCLLVGWLVGWLVSLLDGGWQLGWHIRLRFSVGR